MATGREILLLVERQLRAQAGLVVWLETAIISVYPSGGAFASAVVPMIVLAPARFSTTTGLPPVLVQFCAIVRPSTSTEPPGGKGTMMVIGWSG